MYACLHRLFIRSGRLNVWFQGQLERSFKGIKIFFYYNTIRHVETWQTSCETTRVWDCGPGVCPGQTVLVLQEILLWKAFIHGSLKWALLWQNSEVNAQFDLFSGSFLCHFLTVAFVRLIECCPRKHARWKGNSSKHLPWTSHNLIICVGARRPVDSGSGLRFSLEFAAAAQPVWLPPPEILWLEHWVAPCS